MNKIPLNLEIFVEHKKEIKENLMLRNLIHNVHSSCCISKLK